MGIFDDIVGGIEDFVELSSNKGGGTPIKPNGSDKNSAFQKYLKRLKRTLIIIFVGIFLFCLANGAWYTLDEDEYGVVRTFGQISVVENPGLNFKVPILQKVKKINKASKQFSIGYDIETDESIYKESFIKNVGEHPHFRRDSGKWGMNPNISRWRHRDFFLPFSEENSVSPYHSLQCFL